MPMNDATSSPAIYAVEQKHSKHNNPNITIMSATTTTTNMNINTLKTEMPLSAGSSVGGNSNTSGVSASHAFYGSQGQKWQQVFDFDKVLKQLRAAEKTFLRSKGGSTDRQNTAQGSNTSSSVIQVQRLNAQDMQFFDLAPKQTARDIVICSACMGYYTKMGFNNHMMVQHPSIWSSVSNKLSGTHAHDGVYGALHHNVSEHSLDSIREGANAPGEVIGSPTDMSGTVSTCSSNSSSLSSPFTSAAAGISAVAVPPVVTSSSTSRHKNSKSSSSKTGSSSGSNRSRSKTKSHHHITSSSSSTNSTTEVSTSTQGSHKSGSSTSKKSAGSTAATHSNSLSVSLTHAKDTGDGATTPAIPITLYSSSSNSSCSLPATPKMVGMQDAGSVISGVALDNGGIGRYSPSMLTLHDAKDKHDRSSTSLGSMKKKAKSPAVVLIQESVDSTTSSSSSSEFERNAHKHKPHYTKAPTKPISASQMPPYDMQMTELDQAVSSITGGTAETTVKISQLNESMTGYGQQMQMPAAAVEPIQHNTSDENSISLTLDEMLDSKFINEILNTAESEIPFDESVLDPALQQPTAANTSYMQQQQQSHQQPSSKRMRYDDGTMQTSVGAHTNTEGGVPDYTAAYQHTQQQYDTSNLNDMKLYHQDSTAEAHQAEQQLTTIDAMQLQQLIYQQQQMLEAEQKQQMNVESGGYTTLAAYEPANQQVTGSATAESQQFSVYDVPSLTDDTVDTPGNGQQENPMMMPTGIIYEITGNNQVSVMDQQSQQQVIAEFLTQAGYDNVEGINVLAAADGDTHSAVPNVNGINAGSGSTSNWAEYSDLCDFDSTKLETVTSLNSASTSSSATTTTTTAVKTEAKTVKLEANKLSHCQPHRQLTHTKNHEDYYFNVFLYAGVPRPMAMNNFGMVKLPQSTSTTFRKHLLTTRKANNNLLPLGGSNGSVSRFSPLHTPGNAKQNYYGSNTPGSAGGNANEFSIGSITITNASNNNMGAVAANIAQQTNNNGGKNKTIPATLTVVAPTMRGAATTNGGGNGIVGIAANAKTIHVHKSNTISNERIKCVKRAMISKIDYNKNGMFTAKKLNELLNGKVTKEKEKPEKIELQQQPPLQQQEKIEPSESLEVSTEDSKLHRVQSFYEKRRKLINMSSDVYIQNEQNNHPTHQNHHRTLRPQALQSPPMQYTQKQRQEKLLKKQLMRTFSDCGINQWKSASNSPSGSGGGSGNVPTGVATNDLMRVFV